MPVGCSLLVGQESKGHRHAPLVCHLGSNEVELAEHGRPGVKGAVLISVAWPSTQAPLSLMKTISNFWMGSSGFR